MSLDPQMIGQLLMSQGQQPQSVGGMQGQSAMGGAGPLLQKLMLIRALQGQNPQQPQQPQQPPTGPGGFPLPQGTALPQQMNQQPMPGGSNA